MGKILIDLFTGRDGETQDIARWLATVSILVGLSLSIYSTVWQDQEFSLQDFGLGVGLMFTGFGAMVKLKENSEPGEKQ